MRKPLWERSLSAFSVAFDCLNGLQLFIGSGGSGIVGTVSSGDSMQTSMLESDHQQPIDSFRAIAFPLIFREQVDAEVSLSMMRLLRRDGKQFLRPYHLAG